MSKTVQHDLGRLPVGPEGWALGRRGKTGRGGGGTCRGGRGVAGRRGGCTCGQMYVSYEYIGFGPIRRPKKAWIYRGKRKLTEKNGSILKKSWSVPEQEANIPEKVRKIPTKTYIYPLSLQHHPPTGKGVNRMAVSAQSWPNHSKSSYQFGWFTSYYFLRGVPEPSLNYFRSCPIFWTCLGISGQLSGI